MMQQQMGGGGGGGGGKGGGGSSWDVGPPMKKRKGQAACWFFIRRVPCGYGNECTFSHDAKFCETAAADDPDLFSWKTELCPHAEKKKGCKFGAHCHYAHGVQELLQPGQLLMAWQNGQAA